MSSEEQQATADAIALVREIAEQPGYFPRGVVPGESWQSRARLIVAKLPPVYEEGDIHWVKFREDAGWRVGLFAGGGVWRILTGPAGSVCVTTPQFVGDKIEPPAECIEWIGWTAPAPNAPYAPPTLGPCWVRHRDGEEWATDGKSINWRDGGIVAYRLV